MGATFDPKRVAEILLPGAKSPHLLVRGNMPLNPDGGFAYQEIEEAVNMTFIQDRFVDVSLIDNTGERDSWSTEVEAFHVQPDTYPAANWPPYLHQPNWNPKGFLGNDSLSYGKPPRNRTRAHLVWWPFEGLPPNTDPEVFLTAPGWDFGGLVEYLYGLYRNDQAPPTVIYIHCMLGADRTGALHAGLLVKSGIGIDEALQIVSQATDAGSPSPDYRRLARAYAASLDPDSSVE